jgi:hypothetical protein
MMNQRTNNRLIVRTTAVICCLLAGSACGSRSSQPPPADSDQRSSERSAIASAKDFSRSRFDERSAAVDNKWFPLRPGTRYVFEGHATDDEEILERRVIATVTDLVKEIDGVDAAVVWERDYDSGELAEAELAFFAQDEGGNVWLLGEYPEEYEDGELDKAPAWIAGQRGAKAGLAMTAEPRLGTGMRSYAQGYSPPPVLWNDRARVFKVGQRTCVPAACYDDVLVIEEFERTKPGAFQLKYYAPHVGNVRVGWRGPKEEEKETLVLVDLVQLGADALAKVRDEALKLEKHAYEISQKVYGRTSRARPS